VSGDFAGEAEDGGEDDDEEGEEGMISYLHSTMLAQPKSRRCGFFLWGYVLQAVGAGRGNLTRRVFGFQERL
jgi:hypothetical protein